MHDEELLMRIWISSIEGIGNMTAKKLLQNFHSIGEVLSCKKELLEAIVTEQKAKLLYNYPSVERVKELLCKYEERNINIIYPGHPDYPEKLFHIYDYPEILYIKGDVLRIPKLCVGVVGSRYPGAYGKQITALFVGELSKRKIGIVSGLARGIDAAAHRQAVISGGVTIAVLGCGINVTYPRENAELFSQIETSGVIISEYGLDIQPNPRQFPIRNRIISALSDGVFVVEAKRKSGSLITADLALEQGKQVYALPGRINDSLSEGTNNLIKQGAICVTDVNDIIEDLFGVSEETNEKVLDFENNKIKRLEELSTEEKKVYECLSLDPMYTDDIIRQSKCSIRNTISILYNLEQKGIIEQTCRGYYVIKL